MPGEREKQEFRPLRSMALRNLRYADLVTRDGEKCRYCGKPNRAGYTLQIHHKNRNTSDNRLENLALACPSCNIKEYWRWLKAHLSEQLTDEKEREKARMAIGLAGADASGEFTVAPTLWTTWNAWMKTQIIKYGCVTVHDAIYESARSLKAQWGFGSSVTTRRYLKEAIGDGKNGDFVKAWNQNLGNVVQLSEKAEKRLLAQ